MASYNNPVTPRKPQNLTYKDYLSWNDENRWEIIHGEPFAMTPSPRTSHQRLVSRLAVVLSNSLADSGCEAFVAPLDVKLSDSCVVQPDLMVVCNPQQITERTIDGPPTLIIEVLSPSTLRHDRVRKLNLYAEFGVQEYWLVTPEPPLLEVLSLSDNGRYSITSVYTELDNLRSPVFSDFNIPLKEVFGPPTNYPEEVREGVPPGPLNR